MIHDATFFVLMYKVGTHTKFIRIYKNNITWWITILDERQILIKEYLAVKN